MSAGVTAGGRRAWGIVATLAVTETVSWGVLYYGFSVFLRPVSEALGWSRGSMSAAFSVALLLQGATAVLVGRWLDRHSPRLLMTVGSCLATVGVVLWSQVNTFAAFAVLWAAQGVVMATVLYEPAFIVVTKWFSAVDRRRALTAVTLVAGFASTIFLPLENALIERYGWRSALGYEGLTRFAEDAKAKTIVLAENFRSREEVVAHATKLIAHNDPERIPKNQRPTRGPGGVLAYVSFGSLSDECEAVAREVTEEEYRRLRGREEGWRGGGPGWGGRGRRRGRRRVRWIAGGGG